MRNFRTTQQICCFVEGRIIVLTQTFVADKLKEQIMASQILTTFFMDS